MRAPNPERISLDFGTAALVSEVAFNTRFIQNKSLFKAIIIKPGAFSHNGLFVLGVRTIVTKTNRSRERSI
jgi:hypothetical protein